MAYNKYRNKKVEVDGIKFDSKKEANRYLELKLLQKAGVIKNLKLQPRFLLQDKFKHEGKTIRKAEYVADFMYLDVETGEIVVEDAKGKPTDLYKLKRKFFLKRYGEQYRFKEV